MSGLAAARDGTGRPWWAGGGGGEGSQRGEQPYGVRRPYLASGLCCERSIKAAHTDRTVEPAPPVCAPVCVLCVCVLCCRYDTANFLDKNKDYVVPEHQVLLSASSQAFVSALFTDKEGADAPEAGGGGGRGRAAASRGVKFNSVGSQFKKQLGELMVQLHAMEPHYVRCIKPNESAQVRRRLLGGCLCGHLGVAFVVLAWHVGRAASGYGI